MQGVLFRHFEKGALALSLAFLVVAARPLLARPAELALVDDVVRLDAELQHHLDTYSPDVPPVPDMASKLVASVAAPDPVEPFPGWLAHKRPNFIYDFVPHEPPPPSKHVAPTLTVKATHGSVTIEWGPDSGNECVVTRYLVQRTDAKGATIVLADAKEPGKLVDDKVEPRATYTYSVTETADPAPQHAALALKGSSSRRASPPRCRASSSSSRTRRSSSTPSASRSA